MKKFQLSFKMTCISFGALATTDSKFPFAKKKKTKKKKNGTLHPGPLSVPAGPYWIKEHIFSIQNIQPYLSLQGDNGTEYFNLVLV